MSLAVLLGACGIGQPSTFPATSTTTAAPSELDDRCEPADEVVATLHTTGFRLADAYMVQSSDDLESWYFISARVEGGSHDGEVATWLHVAFSGHPDVVNTPRLAIPVNDVASSLDTGTDPRLLRTMAPGTYGYGAWDEVEGFAVSQECVRRLTG